MSKKFLSINLCKYLFTKKMKIKWHSLFIEVHVQDSNDCFEPIIRANQSHYNSVTLGIAKIKEYQGSSGSEARNKKVRTI